MTGSPDQFLASWHEAVTVLFAGRRQSEREATVRALLDQGLESVLAHAPRRRRVRPAPADLVLEAERLLVSASGLFDAPAYETANVRVRSGWERPLEHFCGTGWRELANPSLGFDLWWYWAEHLDPTRETVNPLVHYLLEGRFAGFSPLPPVLDPVDVRRGDPGARRVCLFAGYDPQGIVDESVLAYVRELSRHADVYCLFDGYVATDDLALLAEVAKGAWAVPHGRYDFGSYSMLAQELVGWDVIDQYDELVLANDSTYLLRPLDEVFEEMTRRPWDWWGLQASKHDYYPFLPRGPVRPLAEALPEMVGRPYMDDVDHMHISSYFLVFGPRAMRDPGFRRRLDAVVAQPQKALIIRKYEIGISRYLMCAGLAVDTYIPDLYPFHPIYSDRYFELVERGFPLLKRNLLTENSGHVPDLRLWKERILEVAPGARVDLIEANLRRVGPDDKLQRSFALDSRESHPERALRPLNRWEIAEEDATAPRFDHWWAFVVDASDHTLTGSLRAVFEEVRDDPSLKKVVLTRTHRVQVEGANVVCLPLESQRGQRMLARSRYVLVREVPGDETLGWFSPRAHQVVNLGGVPLRPFPALGEPHVALPPGTSPYHAVVTGSPQQALAATHAYAPLALEAAWQTGPPRHDLLVRPCERLPADLRHQEEVLVRRLGGRRLLLFVPAFDRAHDRSYPLLSPEVVAALAAWSDASDGVIGFYDDVRDRSRLLAQALDPLGGLNLRRLGVEDHVVADRVAAAMVSDVSARAVDFFATGRPVVLCVDERERLYHDLGSLPAVVVPDAEGLRRVLLTDFGTWDTSEVLGAARRAFFSTLDDRNAQRLVRRLRREYVDGPGVTQQ